MTKILLFQM